MWQPQKLQAADLIFIFIWENISKNSPLFDLNNSIGKLFYLIIN